MMQILSATPPLDACTTDEVHLDNVRRARSALPDDATAADLAALFGALGDPTRIRLLTVLVDGALCVCDLVAALGMTQSAVSHQLRHLRALGVVRARREGKNVWYTLDDDHVRDLLALGMVHVGHRGAGVASAEQESA